MKNKPCFLNKTVFLIILFFVLSQAVLWTNRAAAQQRDTEPVTLDTVVVTASRIEDYKKNNPHLVQEMTREQIQKSSFTGVDQVLNAMPGVEVKKSGAGTGSRISIQGSGGNGKILVLINGRPASATQYGSVDLDSIPLDMVEKVDVFKPPVPVWLGPGSTSGAINIVLANETRNKNKPSKNSRVNLKGGSFGTGSTSASHMMASDSQSLKLTASLSHRDGKRTNTDRDSGSVGFQWDLPSKGNTQYDLSGRYYQSEHGSSGPVYNPTPNARQEYKKGSLDFRVKGFWGETGDYDIKLFMDDLTLEDRSQTGGVATLDELVAGFKNEVTWTDENNGFSLQLMTSASHDRIDHTLSGDHKRENAGIGLQSDIKQKSMTISLGARCDYTSDFHFQPAVNAGLNIHLDSGTRVKLNSGYSVNIPTFGQLYQPSHGSIDQVRGNPDLKEEAVLTVSAGIVHEFSKGRSVEVTLFRTDTDNMIGYEEGLDLIKRPVNIDEASRQGIETTLCLKLSDTIFLDMNHVWQTSCNKENNKDLTYAPDHKFKATVKWTSPFKTRVETSFSALGSQFSDLANSEEKKLSNYQTVDLKFIHPIKIQSCKTQAFVYFENLFDKGYDVHYGYPDDGFRFTIGLTMEF
ncbi:MAG: TonB-dependent receptor plug domain-containing protein [Proteobacteria bacterium]|nr:TonB-dependent receptor plug domain-containing protein [Pseudomonadota bacterium]MBU1585233.1 TonB-dependent receptor plug domain-containing protein [Pseudomonadota bacterium]MBU2454546.1 TonB-dependent receptor plug domain-containing protein [Pseudomonadota bacterium]MBU2629123.1 TonB-dependent receptor plug domain-containing protein [Pseudomonadota bacterium]